MKTDEKIELEIELLFEAIKRVNGIDFSQYKQSSIRRRLQYHLETQGLANIASLIPEIIWNENRFSQLIADISIPSTEFFRDPSVFFSFQEKVFPFLKTFSMPNIWIAGCATGEEVYSMAILLSEALGMNNFKIIATDFNIKVLNFAKEPSYSTQNLKKINADYHYAGGKRNFEAYITIDKSHFTFKPELKKNIYFKYHDLTSDIAISNVHLILCRNVFIYLNKDMQTHVCNLFHSCLLFGGFLCLGAKESLNFLDNTGFVSYDEKHKVYRKPYKLA